MTRLRKKPKKSVARKETDLVKEGKKQETPVQGPSKPNKATKLDTSVKVKRATNERKTSPASSNVVPLINSPKAKSNNLSFCNNDHTDARKATNSSDDDDESGLRHLMTHLVPKLIEGGVVNL